MENTIICSGSEFQMEALLGKHKLWLSIRIGEERSKQINDGIVEYLSIYNDGKIHGFYKITAIQKIEDRAGMGEHRGKYIIFLSEEPISSEVRPYSTVQGRQYDEIIGLITK